MWPKKKKRKRKEEQRKARGEKTNRLTLVQLKMNNNHTKSRHEKLNK